MSPNVVAGDTNFRSPDLHNLNAGGEQRPDEKPPENDVQAVSQLIEDLWQLADTPLEARLWPLSYNRRYERILASYCDILPMLEQQENRQYIVPALIGVRYLRKQNLSVAAELIRNIKFHTVPGEATVYLMKGLSYFAFGLSFLAYVSLAAIHVSSAGGVNPSIRNVFLSFGFGLLGSVVSLLNRISEFEQVGARSQKYFIYTGATSPIVGGIVAIVIAALVESNVITSGALDLSNYWIYVVIGFLSGFSERFSSNLLSIAQGRISGSREQQTTGTTAATEAVANNDKNS